MDFRQDINGLRALAVVVVCLFHFNIPGFSGGFAGVDVFFVISGFLMTGIIVGKIRTGRFSVLEFYMARASRIIPALLVVCLAVAALGWFLLPNDDYLLLGRHLTGAIGFFSNTVFMREAGYFDSQPQDKWLLHSWSLSVEWQFYLLYPLLLAATKRWQAFFRPLLVIGLAVSLLYCLRIQEISPTRAFYLLPTRAWELLAGGLVYFMPTWSDERWRKIATTTGLILVLATVFLVNGTMAWPGMLTLLPVAGTVLVIAAAAPSFAPLAHPVVQWLGKTSYSIYLWHWPVVVLLYHFNQQEQWSWIIAGLLATLLTGYLSYVLIELRSKDMLRHLGRPAWIWLLLPCLITAGLGKTIVRLEGIPGDVRAINHDERARFVQHYKQMHLQLQVPYRMECDLYDEKLNQPRPDIDPGCTSQVNQGSIFLWGDSHAQALSHGLRQWLGDGRPFAQVATSGCRPSLDPQTAGTVNNDCGRSNQIALAAVTRLRPALVILAQERDHEKTDWLAFARHLQSLGVRQVVLFGPVPQWRPSLPVIITRWYWADRPEYASKGLDQAVRHTDSILQQQLQGHPELTYVSPMQSLCQPIACQPWLPGKKELLMVDYGHLTPAASVQVVAQLLGPLLPH
ncbi:MAG: acyltransferase family protein [Pseudomonadota bacterium]|jgi:peptidoglycan/LPS O-acetylase OafA/YrhL